MKLAVLLFTMSFFSLTLFSQNDFAPGYVVKNNADTLRGLLEKTLQEELSKQVNFKSDVNAPVQHFLPADISSFVLEEDLYRSKSFVNIAGDNPVNETRFVKQLVGGAYELYTFLEDEKRFYILKKDTFSYFLYNTEASSRGEYQNPGNYSSRLVLLQNECQKLSAHNQYISYGQKEMTNYIYELNNCMSPGSARNYYHAAKLISQIWVFAGGLPLGAQSQITAEAQFRFYSPSINKKTFLNVGIRFSNTVTKFTPPPTYYGAPYPDVIHTHRIISIPLTIQYNFTNGRIRPYVYGGFSASYLYETEDGEQSNESGFQKSFGFSFVVGAGIDFRIVNKLFIRADYHYELLSQFPAIGVVYQFK